MNMMRDAVEIKRRVAYVGFCDFLSFVNHSIDRLVRKILRTIASAADKDFYQFAPYILVFFAGFIRIRIQPNKEF